VVVSLLSVAAPGLAAKHVEAAEKIMENSAFSAVSAVKTGRDTWATLDGETTNKWEARECAVKRSSSSNSATVDSGSLPSGRWC